MSEEIKRVNFFDGQFLKEQEFIDEQTYHLHMRRRLMYALFAKPGVISIIGDDLSLVVDTINPSNKTLVVKAGMGLALSKSAAEAKELILADPFTTDLSKVQGIAGKTAYITLKYAEEDSYNPLSEGDVNNPTRIIEKAIVNIELDPTKISANNDEGYIILGAVDYDTMTIKLDQRQEAKLRGTLIDFAPTILTQPQSTTVNEGSPITLSIIASGTPPISYQWKKDGVNIGGATNSTLTINSAAAANSGKYSVRVSNTQGYTDSQEVTLNVITAPVITTQPQDQRVTAGSPATFSVIATGQTITYQWKKFDTASSTYKDITGQVSQSLTISSPAITDSGTKYLVHISNSAGSVDSQPATLMVTPALAITTQPSNQTIIEGHTATFTVAATGTGTLTYQWKKNGAIIAGATSASYTTPAETTADNNAKFKVTVSDGVGNSIDSTEAVLTVTSALAITTQPSNQTITEGQTATFTVVATGTGTLTYQWKLNGASITGANSASYTTPVERTDANNAKFKVTVSDSTGNSIDSAEATLSVNALTPIITSAPQAAQLGQNIKIIGQNFYDTNVKFTDSPMPPLGTANFGSLDNISISNDGTTINAHIPTSGIPTNVVVGQKGTLRVEKKFVPSIYTDCAMRITS